MNGTIASSVRRKKAVKDTAYQVICLLLGIMITAPILYAVSISFMRPSEVMSRELHLLPERLYTGNYVTTVKQTNIFRFMLNSFLVAFISSAVRIITSSLAAFSFAFFDFKGKNVLFFLVLTALIIPTDVLLIQNYFTVAGMHLLNTYLGMMVVFFVLPMNIYIMRQNFMSYSRDLKEAAMIDGCGNFRFYSNILLPSSKPIITTVFISSFVGTWNTYLWPLMVTNVDEMRTAQVAITMLNTVDSSPYGTVMAASVIILIPSVLIFVLFQRRVVGGIMAGSVKG